MIRWILYGLILAVVLTVPLERTDVAKLQPVQTVCVYCDESGFVVKTDTGDEGRGETIQTALKDLQETTPAVVYLDTADFVLFAKNAESAIEDMRGVLKGSVEVYTFEGDPDLKDASKYLEIHGNGPVLKSVNKGAKLPFLECKNGRMKLS